MSSAAKDYLIGYGLFFAASFVIGAIAFAILAIGHALT